MPSCTVPMFSKIEVTLRATQPAMLVICQASGSAIATAPTAMRPLLHCQIASARGGDDQRRVHHRQRHDVAGDHPRLVAEGGGVQIDRLAHERVLVARAGEQLDRQDIGVAVDHAPGQQSSASPTRARERSRSRGTK